MSVKCDQYAIWWDTDGELIGIKQRYYNIVMSNVVRLISRKFELFVESLGYYLHFPPYTDCAEVYHSVEAPLASICRWSKMNAQSLEAQCLPGRYVGSGWKLRCLRFHVLGSPCCACWTIGRYTT